MVLGQPPPPPLSEPEFTEFAEFTGFTGFLTRKQYNEDTVS